MAEEVDIRSIWKNSKDKTAVSEINFTSGKKTKTTLNWIKTILWIEFWISIVGIGPVLYFTHQENGRWLNVFYVAITLIYLLYYQFLIRQINAFQYDGNVIESLKKVYGYLRFYLLHYKVVIWASLLLGIFLGILEPEVQAAIKAFESPKQWAVFIGILVGMTLVVGGILHWLIHLIYGKKIRRLRKTVQDLESQE